MYYMLQQYFNPFGSIARGVLCKHGIPRGPCLLFVTASKSCRVVNMLRATSRPLDGIIMMDTRSVSLKGRHSRLIEVDVRLGFYVVRNVVIYKNSAQEKLPPNDECSADRAKIKTPCSRRYDRLHGKCSRISAKLDVAWFALYWRNTNQRV